MPAHIFMRLGYYDEAVKANERAAKVDEDYIQDRHPAGFYPLAYYPHNLHFLFAAAAMEGRSGEALKAARKLVAAVPNEAVRAAPPLEMFRPTPYFALVRFGRWDAMLAEPAPPPDFKYVTGMWRFGRTMALAGSGRGADAAAELQELTRLAAEVPADFIVGLNSAKTLLALAERVAAAELAARAGQSEDAARALQDAIRIEDGLTYDEPPAWYEPVRQRLGAVLLASGRAAEAEQVYRADLKNHPGNGWALFGLSQSLRAQQQPQQAAEAEKRFRQAWRRADVKLTASRF
jgi:tetratricopeptide (TPR) repeat protein